LPLRIEVRLFGGLTERAGGNRVHVDVAAPATVGSVRDALAVQYERLAPMLPRVKVAVDLEVADDEVEVTEDSEVALLPPVAGGAGDDGTVDPRPGRRARVVTGLSAPPLDLTGTLAAIAGPDVGGTAIFLGTVRDHAPDLDGVVGLDYSTYPEMAEKVLADIAAEIERDHPDVTGIALLHTVGELDVMDHTILIVCAAAHRGPAFAACRDALERVKDRAPVWKRERTADGDHRWVGLPDPVGSQPGDARSPGGPDGS
jgi:MoaE-MoaD fusion protein